MSTDYFLLEHITVNLTFDVQEIKRHHESTAADILLAQMAVS